MSSGAWVKLLIRTRPAPGGPVTTPRQTRFGASADQHGAVRPAVGAPVPSGAGFVDRLVDHGKMRMQR